MSNCCNCTYQISGCYNVCEDIVLELQGLEDGTYTVSAGYYSFTATAEDGFITIAAGTLNESDCQELKIEGYTLTVDDKSYDCFKIKTIYQLTAASFDTNTGGVTPEPTEDFCTKVQQCMAGFTPETPAVQAPATVLIQNTTYSLEGYNLEFIGNTVDGDILVRDFDADGNDIGGIQGSNTIGTGNQFNQILGIGNVIGNDNFLNTILGSNNTLGNDNAGAFLGTGNATIGDNTNFIFIYGDDHVVDSNVNYSAAWGFGHHISCDNSYIFGRWGVCPQGGIAIGNGTSDLNRNNAHTLKDTGSYQHTGAYANKPTRYTAGGNHTIPDNVSVYIYDPVSIQAGATITLPANPLDGQDLYIIGGGIITSGNVITGFTLNGNGRTVIGDGGSTLKVGKAYELHYCGDNDIWYAIAF